jgi:hypothetical protein
MNGASPAILHHLSLLQLANFGNGFIQGRRNGGGGNRDGVLGLFRYTSSVSEILSYPLFDLRLPFKKRLWVRILSFQKYKPVFISFFVAVALTACQYKVPEIASAAILMRNQVVTVPFAQHSIERPVAICAT